MAAALWRATQHRRHPAELQQPQRCSNAAPDGLAGPPSQHRRTSDEAPMQHRTALADLYCSIGGPPTKLQCSTGWHRRSSIAASAGPPAKLHGSTCRPLAELHCSSRLPRRSSAAVVSARSCDAAVVRRRLPRGAARTASSSLTIALRCPRLAPLAGEAFSCGIEAARWRDLAAGRGWASPPASPGTHLCLAAAPR